MYYGRVKTSKLRLTKSKVNTLSGICSDIAQISLATVALPAVLDRFSIVQVISGLGVSFLFWFLSLYFSK